MPSEARPIGPDVRLNYRHLIDATALVLLVIAITGLMLALRTPRAPDSDQ